MKHLRTKRKLNKKNIGNIVFAIIFVFVCMSVLITISELVKRPETDVTYAKSDLNLDNSNSNSKIDNSQTWTLSADGLLMNKNGDEIFTQLAESPLEKEIGLSGRDQLKVYKDNNQIVTEGMLFDFGKETTMKFWMKDMNFDLDMIWLDSNYKITHIESNVEVNSYHGDDPNSSETFTNGDALARYVLEVNAGTAKEMNLKVGDILIKKY